jgi:hypothetical protein
VAARVTAAWELSSTKWLRSGKKPPISRLLKV